MILDQKKKKKPYHMCKMRVMSFLINYNLYNLFKKNKSMKISPLFKLVIILYILQSKYSSSLQQCMNFVAMRNS